MKEQVVLVNEQDEVVGQSEKLRAHQDALLHRAFSVMLYRYQGDQLLFLLQQRRHDKYHCGGLWANTCCSHPRPGEETAAAARRRLEEELGVSEISLNEIGHFIYKAPFDNGLTEYEFDHVFLAPYQEEGLPQQFNREEIQALEWVFAKELQVRLMQNPQHYVPWLGQVLTLCMSYLS